MALIRKSDLYRIAAIAWGIVVFGFIILTISGNAQPFLSPEALPIDGPLQMIGVAVALIALGVFVILQLETRSWIKAGKEAGLSPNGAGIAKPALARNSALWSILPVGLEIMSKPDLVGTVDGREVRARTVARNVGGDGESGSNTARFTVVETDLVESTDRGLIVTAGSPPTTGMEDVPADLSNQMKTVGDIAVLGESERFAREAVTPRVQNALAETDTLEGVHAGKSADVFLETIKDSGGLAGSLVGAIETEFRERIPGGPETVGTDRKGVILDGADLEARARAVAAVADGFEKASEAVSDDQSFRS
ncbi:hypothetical protein [Natrinema halophilum]|uniref:Uncharacterized protein n=1 Tax=Natrinema halophilum TaxID=1699371 RepID=A0A7D5KXM5_9EURY|nr:hypothetical protein [Natrinema halophilum]QLG49282.1 hypothetical protein HYG82_10630 [Natrinema halophilum]